MLIGFPKWWRVGRGTGQGCCQQSSGTGRGNTIVASAVQMTGSIGGGAPIVVIVHS